MNLLSICKDPDVLTAFMAFKIIITIFKIAVPIILMVSVTLTFFHAVTDGNEDALSKAFKSTIPKIIAAFLVFLVPTFVNMIGRMVGTEEGFYKSCITNATRENIDKERYNDAKRRVEQAYQSLTESDYSAAVNATKKVKDDNLRKPLNKKLTEIKGYIDLKKEILSLRTMARGKAFRIKYRELYEKIDAIKDERIRTMFEELISQFANGRPLDVEPGLHTNKKYGAMSYHEVIPPHPTTNMALWIFLHGDGGQTTGGLTSYIASGKAYDYEEFIYIAPSPIPFRQDWSGGNIPSNLKALIDHIIEEYEIDEDRIIISGFSRGAIGTWTMVNNYPKLFSIAFPISCRPVGVQARNFKTTVIRAHAGDVHGEAGNYEGDYADDMSSFVKSIKKAGGDAKMTVHPGKKHGECNYVLTLPETIEEALDTYKKR